MRLVSASEVPDTVVAIRLVRPIDNDLRAYQVMEAEDGAAAIRRVFRVAHAAHGDYGMADLIDADDVIVGEVELDRRSFQLVKRRIGARVAPSDEGGEA